MNRSPAGWRRRIYEALAATLACDLDNGSDYLFLEDKTQESISQPQEALMLQAAREIINELREQAERQK